MSNSSKIFTSYRALGFISNHVPLAIRYNKKLKQNFAVTCVGKAFHTYNVSDGKCLHVVYGRYLGVSFSDSWEKATF